jgi:hypothetical protein
LIVNWNVGTDSLFKAQINLNVPARNI